MLPPTNQWQAFCRPDALPVAQPTVSPTGLLGKSFSTLLDCDSFQLEVLTDRQVCVQFIFSPCFMSLFFQMPSRSCKDPLGLDGEIFQRPDVLPVAQTPMLKRWLKPSMYNARSVDTVIFSSLLMAVMMIMQIRCSWVLRFMFASGVVSGDSYTLCLSLTACCIGVDRHNDTAASMPW